MTFEKYLALNAVNASALKKMARSPLHYWHEYVNPDRPPRKVTPALSLGSAFHSLVLENEIIWHEMPKGMKQFAKVDKLIKNNIPWYEVPADVKGTTTVKKAAYAEWLESLGPDPVILAKNEVPYAKWREQETAGNASPIILKPDQVEQIEGMANSIQNHQPAASFIYQTDFEKLTEFTVQWECMHTKCKSRIDLLYEDSRTDEILIVDLKTCRDASPSGWRRDATDFKYYLQAAFYTDAAKYHFGPDREIQFIFVAVESTAPYAVGVYDCSDGTLKQGRREYTNALSDLLFCRQNDSWPGYDQSNTVYTYRLPVYARDGLYTDDEK